MKKIREIELSESVRLGWPTEDSWKDDERGEEEEEKEEGDTNIYTITKITQYSCITN